MVPSSTFGGSESGTPRNEEAYGEASDEGKDRERNSKSEKKNQERSSSHGRQTQNTKRTFGGTPWRHVSNIYVHISGLLVKCFSFAH